MFELKLVGPMQLIGPDGKPRKLGNKSQGLLAILAMARGRPKARSTLQDLLWSDRDERHGRDSLKKAISTLRRAFDNDESILKTKGGPVTLDLSRIEIDLFNVQELVPQNIRKEFLEGLDIHDNQFEAWLRDTRSQLYTARQTQPVIATDTEGIRIDRMSIGIQPSPNKPQDLALQFMSDEIQSRVALALSRTELFEVFDHRGHIYGLQKCCDLVLQLSAIELNDEAMFSFSLRRARDQAIVWGHSFTLEQSLFRDKNISQMVIRSVDQITSIALRSDLLGSMELHVAAKHAMDGMNHLFRLSPEDLDASASSLTKAIEVEPRSSYYAWFAYLSAFKLENSKGRDMAELREHADSIARTAMELDPHNPLTRSLLAHVYSFVFRDFSRASSLLQPLEGTRPDNPIYYHSQAMLYFYTNNFDEAEKFAHIANQAGAFHPFSYAFSTSLCMIELMRGDYKSATHYGKEALSRHRPGMMQYGPTGRYLAAAYALGGDTKKAGRFWKSMSEQSSIKFIRALEDKNFPVPSEAARDTLRGGFRRIQNSIN